MHKRKNRFSPYKSILKHLLAIRLALLIVSVFLGCDDTYETTLGEEPVFLPFSRCSALHTTLRPRLQLFFVLNQKLANLR